MPFELGTYVYTVHVLPKTHNSHSVCVCVCVHVCVCVCDERFFPYLTKLRILCTEISNVNNYDAMLYHALMDYNYT